MNTLAQPNGALIHESGQNRVPSEASASARGTGKQERDRHSYEWIWEVLILLTVTPAVVYGVLSLQHIPVA
jgi:hypothetical protein